MTSQKEPVPADILATVEDIFENEWMRPFRNDEAKAAVARSILAERERCASVADNYSIMAHAAFDMKSKSFPTKSPVQDYIAKQIRGEA